jgi:hypothetical protein
MPGQSENDTKIAKKKAQRLKFPFVDPLRAAIEPSALSLLAPEMAMRRQALPIRVVDNFLLVAMSTPEEPVCSCPEKFALYRAEKVLWKRIR